MTDSVPSLPGEKWQKIPNEFGAFASNFGRIKTVDRYVKCGGTRKQTEYTRFQKGRLIKQHKTNHGYLQCRVNGTQYLVHRLVCTAFHGPGKSNQHVVHHIDENRENNNANNLCWTTFSANSNFSSQKGQDHRAAKLTDQMVYEICCLLDDGGRLRPIAAKYNVSIGTVSNIKNGTSWTHLQCVRDLAKKTRQAKSKHKTHRNKQSLAKAIALASKKIKRAAFNKSINIKALFS